MQCVKSILHDMLALALASLLLAGAAQAAELHVVSSGGFAAAYRALLPSMSAAAATPW